MFFLKLFITKKVIYAPSIFYLSRSSTKDVIYNFDCIESIDIMKVETISTVRGATRIWNMTVQYWIAEYVYRRFPIKKFRYLNLT